MILYGAYSALLFCLCFVCYCLLCLLIFAKPYSQFIKGIEGAQLTPPSSPILNLAQDSRFFVKRALPPASSIFLESGFLKQKIALSSGVYEASLFVGEELGLCQKLAWVFVLLWVGLVFLLACFAFYFARTLDRGLFDAISALDDLSNLGLFQKSKALQLLDKKIQSLLLFQKQLNLSIGHELKTPLSAMKLKADIGLLKQRSSQEYQEILHFQLHNIDQINQTIKYMANLYDNKGFVCKAIDIAPLLQNIMQNFSLIATKEKKQLKFEPISSPLCIETNPFLFTLIIQNLLQNAVKFASYEIICQVRFANLLEICILDDGEGIGELEYFDAFVCEGENRGMGLGLFLAKMAAAALHATVILQNRDTKGAKASLVLAPKMEQELLLKRAKD